jgi:hypothetical protein
MLHFNEDQIKEFETLFGLKRVATIPVRDGRINPGDMVWWRGSAGPEHVKSDSASHAYNISQYPGAYQITKPVMRVEYLD